MAKEKSSREIVQEIKERRDKARSKIEDLQRDLKVLESQLSLEILSEAARSWTDFIESIGKHPAVYMTCTSTISTRKDVGFNLGMVALVGMFGAGDKDAQGRATLYATYSNESQPSKYSVGRLIDNYGLLLEYKEVTGHAAEYWISRGKWTEGLS